MTAEPSPIREPSRPWSAEWIWMPGEPAAENSFYYFRRETELDADGDVCLHVTADTHYRLHVDGELVGQGPPYSQPYHRYYDTYSLPADRLDGEHCVGVLVNYTAQMEDTRGGLLLEVEDDDGTLLETDGEWSVANADAWERDTYDIPGNRMFPRQEHRDIRRAPDGWTEVGFDDSAWTDPEVLGRPPAAGPWSRLVPRDVPFMETKPKTAEAVADVYESLWLRNRFQSEDLSTTLSTAGNRIRHSRIEDPMAFRGEGTTTVQCSTGHREDPTFDGVYDPCVVLDFGRVITGYFELDLQGVAGATVDVGYAERLVDGEFNIAIEGAFADRFTMRDGEQTVRSFAWRSFRYVKLRFSECFEPVDVEAARAIRYEYPFDERGRFDAADDLLVDVFDASRYTIRLCSHDAVVDTPWREQSQWLGDVAAVTLGGIYSCFGDTALAGKFLRQSAANLQVTGLISNITNDVSHAWRNCLSDYSLWWVMALWNHYEYTGDEAWIHDFYPHALRVVQAFEPFVGADGMLGEVSHAHLFDRADVDRDGASAPLNAIFYGICGALERMAVLKGDDHTATRVRDYREGIADGFQDAFFDADRGVFVDAVRDGEQSESVSEHANAVALRWGLADDEATASVIEALYEAESVDYVEAQPFFTSVVLQGLDAAGRFDLALDIVRDRWGDRMIAKGAKSTYEEWGINGSWRSGEFDGFLRTLSHAWSAYPAEFLTRDLVGFEVLEPGCERVAIEPREVDFDYEVTVPTPRGDVTVTRIDGETTVDAAGDLDVSEPD